MIRSNTSETRDRRVNVKAPPNLPMPDTTRAGMPEGKRTTRPCKIFVFQKRVGATKADTCTFTPRNRLESRFRARMQRERREGHGDENAVRHQARMPSGHIVVAGVL